MNWLVEIQKYLELHKNSRQAESMAAYMKNNFNFLGIKAPERKQLFKNFLKEFGTPPKSKLEDIIIGLWSLPYREYQYYGMELADKLLKRPDKSDILIITYMLEYKQWWDSVDFIASHLVGRIFKTHDDIKEQYLNKWITSDDMWLNRTAILFQLLYEEQTDTALLHKAIVPHLSSTEFFHQKAIGWALRQYSKQNPEWVSEFISRHTLKPLSKREASKYL